MVVLGIETSCDETAASVVSKKILSNVVSSSVPLHAKYGGVIPEIASRYHMEYIRRVVRTALKRSRTKRSDIQLVAVADRPGLPGSLLVGVSFAKSLSYALKVPLVYVDHVIAHVYSNFMLKNSRKIRFPFIGAVVSGGHTNIYVCKSLNDFKILGRTKDDAVGEAFDKVAKIMGIGYPGGPKIEKYAKAFKGKNAIRFPRAYLEKDSFDFSLSGIKTSVLRYVKDVSITKKEISRIAWSFQEAVFDVLVGKLIKACMKHDIKSIVLGGGVISNKRLRNKIDSVCRRLGYNLFYPPRELCLDNAAMIAGLGEALYCQGGGKLWH